jgi:hypothetical protein
MAPQFDRPLRDLLRAAGCTMVRQGRGSHEIWHSPITKRNFAVPVGIPSRHTANAVLRQGDCRKRFDLGLRIICSVMSALLLTTIEPSTPEFSAIWRCARSAA